MTERLSPSQVFPEHAEFFGAIQSLYAEVFVAQTRPADDIVQFLEAYPDMAEFLTTPYVELNDLSPLAWYRKDIEDHIRQSSPNPPHDDQSTLRAAIERVFHRPRKPDPGEGFYVQISRMEDIDTLPEAARVVHLSSQPLATIASIEHVLDHCPNLHILEVSPGFDRVISKTTRKLLEARGILLRFARFREEKHYDVAATTNSYKAEKQRFMERVIGSEPYELLTYFESPEAEIASIYYGKKRISIASMTKELGIPRWKVERYLSRFQKAFQLYDADGSIDYDHIVLRKVYRLAYLEKSTQDFEAYRLSLAIGDLLPPPTLRIQYWPTWHALMSAYQSHPELFESLYDHYPKSYVALAKYFQLNQDDTPYTYEDIGREMGYSRERIRQMINQALKFVEASDLGDELDQ